MIRESHLRTCARTKNAKGKSSSGPRGICLVKRSEVLGLKRFQSSSWIGFRDEAHALSTRRTDWGAKRNALHVDRR